VRGTLAVLVAALLAASPALADRPATAAERAAIMATVARMGSFDPGPAKCNHPVIRVSTWDPAYATWRLPSVRSGPCSKYAGSADGLDFFKKAFNSWLFLTRSPAVPLCGSYVQDVSFQVVADFLHCPGGPAKAQCFTTNAEGFAATLAADAGSKVGDMLKACYGRDDRHVASVVFSALPKPHGNPAALVVKTKGASGAQALAICKDASTVSRWYGYDNVTVSVLGGGKPLRATLTPGHARPCAAA
jgi:hypothetical protein